MREYSIDGYISSLKDLIPENMILSHEALDIIKDSLNKNKRLSEDELRFIKGLCPDKQIVISNFSSFYIDRIIPEDRKIEESEKLFWGKYYSKEVKESKELQRVRFKHLKSNN